MVNIAIYGIGKISDFFLKNHDFSDEKILTYIVTEKKEDKYKGIDVCTPEEITDRIEKIYIANSFTETVDNLLNVGVDKNKIVVCSRKVHKNYLLRNKGIDDLKYDEEFALLYEDYFEKTENKPQYVLTETMNNPIQIFECENIQKMFGTKYIVTEDYCRFGTLTLIIEEIKNNKIPGELAELGVYRGDFSKCMNEKFPDKKLYLFDTFEGFDYRDMENDIRGGYTLKEWFDSWDNFKYTYIDLVLEKMKYKEQCIIKKGYFPDTIPKEEVKYALVSLDCDLYDPILAGLRYFYPRISEGGYIMVHDYNQSDHLKGVKEAVKDYEKEIGERLIKVPIPDVCGTMVIGK